MCDFPTGFQIYLYIFAGVSRFIFVFCLDLQSILFLLFQAQQRSVSVVATRRGSRACRELVQVEDEEHVLLLLHVVDVFPR